MAAQHGSGGRVRRRTFLRFLSRIVPGGEHLSVAFGVFLFFHVLAGLTCVATGAVAATSRKRPGRHPRVRHRVLGSLGRFRDRGCHVGAAWPEDAYLLALGTTAFGFASIASRSGRCGGMAGEASTFSE